MDEFYIRYAVARLAAFDNVWWSMANEWSFVGCKAAGINASHLVSPAPTWDKLFRALVAADPYGRQASIHNGNLLYNHVLPRGASHRRRLHAFGLHAVGSHAFAEHGPRSRPGAAAQSRPWIKHVSLQGLEDRTADLRRQFGKPLIWDEVQYEGDLPLAWGALSGAEEADRFWWGASLGVYVGHSETLLRQNVSNDEQPLWWAKYCHRPSNRRPFDRGALSARSLHAAACPLMVYGSLCGGAALPS